jgi:Tfp pilus assembly protein PilO
MKNKTFNILICTAVVALSLLSVLIYGIYYVKTLSEHIVDVKNEANQIKSKYDRLIALHDSAESNTDDKKKLLNYFIPANGAVDFITSFEQTAQAIGLKFNTVSLDSELAEGLDPHGKEFLRIAFETKGSWNSTMQFLSLVESMPYAIQITGATLEGSAGTPSLVGSDSANGVLTNTVNLGYWRLLLNIKVVKIKDDAQ